jgi:hypothetical protein
MGMNKERFDQLAEGLLFMGETDAPLTYYELSPEKSQQWPPSTAGQFLRLIGEDPEAPVEELAPENSSGIYGPAMKTAKIKWRLFKKR